MITLSLHRMLSDDGITSFHATGTESDHNLKGSYYERSDETPRDLRHLEEVTKHDSESQNLCGSFVEGLASSSRRRAVVERDMLGKGCQTKES